MQYMNGIIINIYIQNTYIYILKYVLSNIICFHTSYPIINEIFILTYALNFLLVILILFFYYYLPFAVFY